MKIDKSTVDRLARLSKLEFSENEKRRWLKILKKL